MEDWIPEQTRPLVIIECGAGTAVPTVRLFSESAAERWGTLIRINPSEPEVPDGQIGIPLGALEALERIDEVIQASESRSTARRSTGLRSADSVSGQVSTSPLDKPVNAASGHVVDVVVQAFVTDNIYSGVWEGMSEAWQRARFDAFRKRLVDRWGSRPSVVVEPEVAIRGGAPYRPPHLCAAWLVAGGTLARQGPGEGGSELVVVWYQHYDEEGGLIPSRIAGCIDWHEQAWNVERLIPLGQATCKVGSSELSAPTGNNWGAIAARDRRAGPMIGASRSVNVTIDSLVMEDNYGDLIDRPSEATQNQRFNRFLEDVRSRWGERRTLIVDVGISFGGVHRNGLFASIRQKLTGSWGSKRGTEEWRMEARFVGGSYSGSRRPPYLCAACLTTCGTLAGQGSGDICSELVVVWCQEYGEEGGLIPTRVAESIDWHADAWNFDP
jgi:hypothetical protein